MKSRTPQKRTPRPHTQPAALPPAAAPRLPPRPSPGRVPTHPHCWGCSRRRLRPGSEGDARRAGLGGAPVQPRHPQPAFRSDAHGRLPALGEGRRHLKGQAPAPIPAPAGRHSRAAAWGWTTGVTAAGSRPQRASPPPSSPASANLLVTERWLPGLQLCHPHLPGGPQRPPPPRPNRGSRLQSGLCPALSPCGHHRLPLLSRQQPSSPLGLAFPLSPGAVGKARRLSPRLGPDLVSLSALLTPRGGVGVRTPSWSGSGTNRDKCSNCAGRSIWRGSTRRGGGGDSAVLPEPSWCIPTQVPSDRTTRGSGLSPQPGGWTAALGASFQMPRRAWRFPLLLGCTHTYWGSPLGPGTDPVRPGHPQEAQTPALLSPLAQPPNRTPGPWLNQRVCDSVASVSTGTQIPPCTPMSSGPQRGDVRTHTPMLTTSLSEPCAHVDSL